MNRAEGLTRVNSKDKASEGNHQGDEKNVAVHCHVAGEVNISPLIDAPLHEQMSGFIPSSPVQV
jgi:hypothetical protein